MASGRGYVREKKKSVSCEESMCILYPIILAYSGFFSLDPPVDAGLLTEQRRSCVYCFYLLLIIPFLHFSFFNFFSFI